MTTFLLSKPSDAVVAKQRTDELADEHKTLKTAMGAALSAALSAAPSADTPTIVAPVKAPPAIKTFTDFTTLLAPAAQARRYCMWVACNSLNNYIIANLQADIRMRANTLRTVNDDTDYFATLGLDQKTIDILNEQKALHDEMKANQDNSYEQGFERQVSAIEVAEALVNLRGYIAGIMKSTAKSVRDLAQPISDSIAFRISKRPEVDETKVMRWFVAADGSIPIEELRRVSFKQQLSDRQQLINQMGEVVDLAAKLSWGSLIDDNEAEDIFDSLPAHVRYKLLGGMVKALKAAMASEVSAFLRFNRYDSITNRVIIGGVMEGYIDAFSRFGNEHADELMAYLDRGTKLPTLDELLADKSD